MTVGELKDAICCDLCRRDGQPCTNIPLSDGEIKLLCRECCVSILMHFNALGHAYRDERALAVDQGFTQATFKEVQ